MLKNLSSLWLVDINIKDDSKVIIYFLIALKKKPFKNIGGSKRPQMTNAGLSHLNFILTSLSPSVKKIKENV